MSIYGEGSYDCQQCGIVNPSPRPVEQLRHKQWETLCPQCGEVLKPVSTQEDKPLQCTSIYALSKKDQEEMTLRQIAKVVSLHESRISQIKAQAIVRLRVSMDKLWPGSH